MSDAPIVISSRAATAAIRTAVTLGVAAAGLAAIAVLYATTLSAPMFAYAIVAAMSGVACRFIDDWSTPEGDFASTTCALSLLGCMGCAMFQSRFHMVDGDYWITIGMRTVLCPVLGGILAAVAVVGCAGVRAVSKEVYSFFYERLAETEPGEAADPTSAQ